MNFHNRRAKILRDEYEKQISSLKTQHELSVKRLNNEIEKLYGEKHALLAEFENLNTHGKINTINGQQIISEKLSTNSTHYANGYNTNNNNAKSNRSSVSSIHAGGKK